MALRVTQSSVACRDIGAGQSSKYGPKGHSGYSEIVRDGGEWSWIGRYKIE